MNYSMWDLAQKPELENEAREIGAQAWPEFMLQDPVADKYWERLFDVFPNFQIVVCDDENNVVAAGNTIPFRWNGETETLPPGWDAVLERGFSEHERGIQPTALSALQAIVSPEHRGRGLSVVVLNAMKAVASQQNLNSLVAPVRPTLKSRYPHVPMERYVRWSREDGHSFDPWLRVHAGLGAKILGVAPRSMVITGSVSDWEVWTGMEFRQSGEYVVPGALQPVEVDLEADLGTYEEPNVWMQHTVPTTGRGKSEARL